MKRALLALPVALLLAAPASAKTCPKVSNPYAGTEYDGVDLTGIRATGVSCGEARRVARGAHRKALGMTPTGPVRTYVWRGWGVRGDLRGGSDKYVAEKGGATVRWRF